MNNKLFIWIPKTSGTSFYESYSRIDPTFVKKLDGTKISNGTHGHYLVSDIYNKEEMSKFDIFTIVRNPFSRAVSLFEYLKKNNLFPRDKSFKFFLETVKSGVPPVGPYNRIGLSQCNLQKDWIPPDVTVKIYRLENRGELLRDFQLKNFHTNRSVYKDYRRYYDSVTFDLTKDIFKKDFQYFNYPEEL